jgi:hypothetical protein
MKFRILAGVAVAGMVLSAYALAVTRNHQSPVPDSPTASQKGTAGAGKKHPAPGETVVRTSPKQDRLALKVEDPQIETTPPVELMVNGIATGDLLNIRVSPSPGARIVARLDNGTLVKKLGCEDVSGNQWCKVQTIDSPQQTGWAAGRYLTDLGGEPTESQL